MFLINFPLMLVPFAVYNFFIFGQDANLWDRPAFQIQMMSGATFVLGLGQCLIVVGLLLLFVEIIKATRHGVSSIVDHLLSTLVFIAFVVEFLLVGRAATATFFILMTMTFVDVIAGYSVSIRNSSRDLTIES
jgi:hypothetical protein